MGDKYILELEDKPLCVFDEDTQTYFPRLHRVKGFNSLVFDQNGLDRLTSYTAPDLEQVREEAYEKGYKTAKLQCNIQAEKDLREVGERHYQKGLSDAWEAARKILKANWEERHEMFGAVMILENIFLDNTASEAIEKIRQYEQAKEIKVGDEVRNIQLGWTAVVSAIDRECMTLMDTNGKLGDGYDMNRFIKTGRHFPEIAEVLEKMRESE